MHKKTLFIIIILAYLLPTFIQPIYSENNKVIGTRIGFPGMQSGDEPHYYITLYSIINDGDIFLTNNYNNALYKQGHDLGKKRFTIFDRHTRIFDAKNKTVTSFNFSDGHINLRQVPEENTCITEVSGHPIGLPIFAAVFLWSFKNTPALEHLTIYLTLLFTIISLFAFYNLLMFYHKSTNIATIFTGVLAFGTQYWHYSKTFYAEPYLASFLVIIWYLLIVKKQYFIPGTLLAFGFLIKYPFILLSIPTLMFLIYKLTIHQLKIKNVIAFLSPQIVSFVLVLYVNYFLTGSFLHFNQAEAVHFIISLKGIFNWLFNPSFGLFTFSPILIFAFVGVKNLWNKNKIHSACIMVTILFYFLFWAFYAPTQNGAGGYSARYLLVIIPFLVLLASFGKNKNKLVKNIFVSLFIVSVIINSLAAFAYPAFQGYQLHVSLLKIARYIDFTSLLS